MREMFRIDCFCLCFWFVWRMEFSWMKKKSLVLENDIKIDRDFSRHKNFADIWWSRQTSLLKEIVWRRTIRRISFCNELLSRFLSKFSVLVRLLMKSVWCQTNELAMEKLIHCTLVTAGYFPSIMTEFNFLFLCIFLFGKEMRKCSRITSKCICWSNYADICFEGIQLNDTKRLSCLSNSPQNDEIRRGSSKNL